jgi:anti-sigma regulatory factor (Ser/Thr protein kinase)
LRRKDFFVHMENKNTHIFKIKFPSDLDYIAPVRKFVAETLAVTKFSPKFAYRSEVIVDEICHNAIIHGSRSIDATVEMECKIFPDRFEFQVNDQGGKKDDLDRLKSAVKKADRRATEMTEEKDGRGLGLEIVRLLSEEVKMEVGQDNMTTVHVVRKREDL